MVIEALNNSSVIYYDVFLTTIGVTFSIILGLLLQNVTHRRLTRNQVQRRLERVISSLIFGGAIMLMHYIGHISAQNISSYEVNPLLLDMKYSVQKCDQYNA